MIQPLRIKEAELYIYDYKISAITNDYTDISDYTGGGAFNLPTVEAVANSLFDLSGKTVDKLIVNDKYLYVCDSKGNNDTAIKGNPFRCYKTIQAAYSASTIGDVVYVMSGDYNVDTNLAKNGVGYYFEQNTNVSATTILFLYFTTYSTSITHDINILGYGNFYCGNNLFFAESQDDTQLIKYPINVNTNLEFNNVVCGGVVFNTVLICNNDNYYTNIKGKYLYINTYYLYVNTRNVNFNINIDIVVGNVSYDLVRLDCVDYTKHKIKYNSIRTLNNNTSYYDINVNYSTIYINKCNRMVCSVSTINVDYFSYLKILNISTINALYVDGTIDSEASNIQQTNIINCPYIKQLNINTFGKHIINGCVSNLVNNGVNSQLILNNSSEWNSGVWIFNSGTTIINGEFTNYNQYYDNIQVLGEAKVFINATINITPTILSNNSFIYINHPNAYVEINNNIYTKNINNVIYLKDGKLKLKGDIQMDGYNNLSNESAIIYDGGEIVMSNSTLKSTLGYEQYPISCINNPKSLKILSGGLNVNKETFDARKQKIEIVVGGTVLSSETYSLALSSISYITSGHTTESEVVSGFTSQISALANFTVVNNNNSFTVECNNVSEVFTYNISKTIGTGTMTQRLVRYATYPLTNSTGGTIIIDEDI